MKVYNKDQISIVWHIDDVKSLDNSLTDEQCRQVLSLAKEYHDATQGINWDVLEYWIGEIK